MTALVTAKFSPVVPAQIDPAHQLKRPIQAARSAADTIIDHAHQPSYTFRLSLRDGWVIPFLLRPAKKPRRRRDRASGPGLAEPQCDAIGK